MSLLHRPFSNEMHPPITQVFGNNWPGVEPDGFLYPDGSIGYEPAKEGAWHNGVDYGLDCGIPIRSPASGHVIYAGWMTNGFGNAVQVRHDHRIQGRWLITLVAHLSEVRVAVGDHVLDWQVVGISGTTGNSTGCHLHWSVIDAESGLYLPPAWFVYGRPQPK